MNPNLTQIAKWILPAGVADLVRARRNPSPKLWEGIYRKYREVPARGEGYNSDAWIVPRVAQTANLRAQLRDEGSLTSIPSRYLLLPACASAMTPRASPLRILDFGGAIGVGYVYFRAAARGIDPIEYYVVDNQRSCNQGEAIFTNDPDVRFRINADEVPASDIVFMSGVLQYVDEYVSVLRDLAKRHQPRLFLLTLVPVGRFPTFASAQVNLKDSSMPVWFFQLSELEALFRELGYALTFRDKADLTFDMSNFPASHRLDWMSNLVFSRTS